MIVRPRIIRFFGILLMLGAALLMGLAFFLPRFVDINSYRKDLLETLQKSLNRPVSFATGSFAWRFGPSLVFKNITIKEPDGSAVFLSAEQITMHISLLPLLEQKIELSDIHLQGADLSLIRNADGSMNIDDLLKPAKKQTDIRFKKIQLKKGTVRWLDLAQNKKRITATLSNLSASFDNLAQGKKGTFKLYCDIPASSGPPARISFSGSAKIPAAGKSLLDTELNCEAEVKQGEIGRFWPYYGRFFPFPNTEGRLDFSTTFKGKPQNFSAKSRITVSGAKVNWPKVFHAQLSPESLNLDFSIKLTRQLIDISSLDAGFTGFRIKGALQIHDYLTEDPRIVARASTPETFRYEDVKYYVPYGIIEKDTSDYIENKIKTGVFKLDTGALDGRISQITHMELGENSNVLYIRGPVEKAVLSYGPKAPTFNNIKGTIELKGKNFNLIGMSGNFGISPFKMNGTITEYNTDKPSDYPVRMEITPHAPEVAWLAKIAGVEKLEYGSTSSLILTGTGHYSAYRLSGDWDLKKAAYSFPGAIRKNSGMTNRIEFSSVIGRSETRLASLFFNMHPISLSGSAVLKYGEKYYLGFDIKTAPFTLNETLPILSIWKQYRPRGKVEAHLKGSGNPVDFSAMDYNGEIMLNDFSFEPDENLKPVTGINGAVSFKGNSLETSSVTARYGSSVMTMEGRIRSLHNPEADISLSTPKLFLRDVNLAKSRPDAVFENFNANFTLRDGSYNFKNVSGLLNSSNFKISGTYLTKPTPEANLSITSTKLDFDDLRIFSLNEKTDYKSDSEKLDVKVKLNVDAANYGKLHFANLSATAHQESGTIYLDSITAGILGGKLAAKGKVVPQKIEGDSYDLTIDLVKADAEKMFTALDISRDVTGSLTLRGDLTAKGNNLLDLKKSAAGNVKLQMNRGKLRKFSTLSKVFSIMNISQLLKFQLPDMVSGGMPYNDIAGNITVKNGAIATQDLFISSDAINISVIGSADIVKEDLNLTIGVQPLQTVDKIVNRIPVVGWLLTGKDKDFLTAYFEANGKWADPQVSAIPVKSIGKGIFNIFRRVFELPVRLFTDTGEVVFGQ